MERFKKFVKYIRFLMWSRRMGLKLPTRWYTLQGARENTKVKSNGSV